MTGLLDRIVATAVLFREAARQSRRWQMYAARAGFSGALLSVLLLGIYLSMNAPFVDKSEMGWLGRGMFVAFAMAQVFLSVVLAPLMVAGAVIEEVEDNTMDLLVLTRLTPGQILSSKILSRVLVLMTIVAGALPVMAMVVTLGGVSTKEVVAVTVHTLTSVVVLGAMGGFFGLFTRSPLLAMMATAAYTLPMYWLLPMGYAMTTGDLYGGAHFSPVMGPFAVDWWALLPVLGFAPVVGLLLSLGKRLFELRVARASIRKAFSAETWQTKQWGFQLGALVVSGVVLLGPLTIVNWTFQTNKGGLISASVDPLIHGATTFATWAWWAFALYVGTWAFLRVGMDIVDVLDTMLGRRHKGKKGTKEPNVWSNPITWWEARPRAWGVAAVPLLVTWGLVLLGMFQTGWWIFPGGLLLMGALNTVATFVLTIWLATWSIVRERKARTLELVLTTTMPSWRIMVGKVAGAALPTGPLLLLSGLMIVPGVPHLYLFMDIINSNASTMNFAEAIVRGLLHWLWCVPVWFGLVALSMTIALRMKRARPAFGVTLSIVIVLFGIPALIGRLAPDLWILAGPAKLVAPGLVGNTAIWQIVVSIGLASLAAVGLLGLASFNLRRWAANVMVALLVLGLGSSAWAAPYDPNKPQDGFYIEAAPLADGMVRDGDWAAVRVKLANEKAGAVGRLRIVERSEGATSIAWEREVELPRAGRKSVVLLYKPGLRHGERQVEFVARSGRYAAAPFLIEHLTDHDVAIGVIGVDAMGLTGVTDAWKRQVIGRHPRQNTPEGQRRVRTGLIYPLGLPDHHVGYGAVDVLVWPGGDPSPMSERQLTALRHWIADGGHLVLTVTDSWRALRDSSFEDALPVRLTGLDDADNVDPLILALGGGQVGQASMPVASARLKEEQGRQVWQIVRLDDGRPGWVIGTYGLGTVTVVLADPNVSPLKSSLSRKEMWRRLLWLPRPNANDQYGAGLQIGQRYPGPLAEFFGQYSDHHTDALAGALRLVEPDSNTCWYGGKYTFDTHYESDVRHAWEREVREELADIPGVAPLPMSWLLVFSGLYLLFIGPVDYILLRAIGRQPWTWFTFPIAIVVFSATALIGTSYVKGSQAVVSRVEVVDVLPGAATWRGDTWIGVFSTRKTQLTLTSGFDDGVVSPLRETGFMNNPSALSGEGPGSMQYRAETWTLGYSRSSWVADNKGAITIDMVSGKPGSFTVTNELGVDLENAWLVLGPTRSYTKGEGRVSLGAFDDGETRTVDLADAQRLPQSDGSHEDRILRLLFDHADSGRGHLDLFNLRMSVVGFSSSPYEPVGLEGLRPVDKSTTMFRVPLTPTFAPNPARTHLVRIEDKPR